MKKVVMHLAGVLLLSSLACAVEARAQRKPQGAKAKPTPGKSKAATPKAAGEDAKKAELDEIVKLGASERVERLQAFVKANADSPSLLRAQELLTSARAALGDERLRGGDRAAGVELFRAAVAEAPSAMSDKLFVEVVSQLPANLYVLGGRDAAMELARAVEWRATGKPEEALALYREQFAADPQDANARTGLVLSLFDAGKREEAERELQSALTGEAKDLPLLVGASYWYAAHGGGARALELAEKAVAFEPRFGWAWARIAEGRALLALKRPLEAE